MLKKLSNAMGKSSSFHSERKPPAPPPPQASPPGCSSDNDNFDSASSSADSLEGSIELTIVLPNGKTVFMSVEKRMPMMDLLIHVATSNKISPGSHVISVFNDNSKDSVTYTPSTPVGMLNTSVIYVVPKKNSENLAKKPTRMSSTEPVEHTFRLQVHLPRNQLLVLRVSQQINLADLHEMICAQKGLDASRYGLQHPLDLDIPLDYSRSLADYNLTEINFVSKRSTIVVNYNNSPNELLDIGSGRESADEKKRKAMFGFVFRRSKSSLGDSSSDDRSSRGVSPTRSDGSGHQSLSPPLSSPPNSIARHVVKKRPAPLPPAAAPKQRTEKPPPPPPFRSKSATLSSVDLEHTRTKSDSSVSLDHPSFGEASEKYDLPASSKKISMSKMGAASSLSNLSTTSSSTSGSKKRRAPLPPMQLPDLTNVALDYYQPPSGIGMISSAATISASKDTVHFIQSPAKLHESLGDVQNVEKQSFSKAHADPCSNNNDVERNEISTMDTYRKEEVISQRAPTPVQRQIYNEEKYSIPDKQLESLVAKNISDLKQEVEPKHVEETLEVEKYVEPDSVDEKSAKSGQRASSVTNVNEVSKQQPSSDETNATEQRTLYNDKEVVSAVDQQFHHSQFEQDQAINMVHEVFQDIDQDYSDEYEDDLPDSAVEDRTDDLNSSTRKCYMIKNTADDITAVQANTEKLPRNSHEPHSLIETTVTVETGLTVSCESVLEKEVTEKGTTAPCELPNEADGALMSPSSFDQPSVPTPSLLLSSVAPASAHPVDCHGCPECPESALNFPIQQHPVSSSSYTEPSHKFSGNGSLPDHHENSAYFLSVEAKSAASHASSPALTLSSYSTDSTLLHNKMASTGDLRINQRNHVSDANMSEIVTYQQESIVEKKFIETKTELHFHLPDHHERAIQTSPWPDLSTFGSQPNVIMQDSIYTAGSKSDENLANGSSEMHRSIALSYDDKTHNVCQTKLGQISAAFPADRRQHYQWNDALVCDSLHSAGLDDDWVSSCSEDDTGENDALPDVILSDVARTNQLNSDVSVPTEEKMDTHVRECVLDIHKRRTLMDSHREMACVREQDDVLVHECCDGNGIRLSEEFGNDPALLSQHSMTQGIVSTQFKSKANTLPHNATKITGDDASKKDLTSKASTLPSNTSRGNATEVSLPPVPKFKRPLMNFSISTYQSRTEVEPSYETRLAKSESFCSQSTSQQARAADARPVVRGSSFQTTAENKTRPGMEKEFIQDIRQRSSTLPANPQSVPQMSVATKDVQIKSNLEKASSLTHLANYDESQVFRTQSVQNLGNGLTGNDDILTLPADREEVLILQQEYFKLQKQLLHWQQQLLSNQHLLQKQHILPDNSFQLSPETLLLKKAEDDVTYHPETLDCVKEPQLVKSSSNNHNSGDEHILENNPNSDATEVQKSHFPTRTYMKLHMCQPYKIKTDIHGKVAPPKQKVDMNVKGDASNTNTVALVDCSYKEPFVGVKQQGTTVRNSQFRFNTGGTDSMASTDSSQMGKITGSFNTDSHLSQEISVESGKAANITKTVCIPKSADDTPGIDTEISLPSVKDRVSMLFGTATLKDIHSQASVKSVAGNVVDKNSSSSCANKTKMELKPPGFTNRGVAKLPYSSQDIPPAVASSSFPVASNLIGRCHATAVSEGQNDEDRQSVLSSTVVSSKHKFRRQRFEPAVLRDESSSNVDNGEHRLNGSHKFGVNTNTGKEVQFTINSSASQQRKEWEAPSKPNKQFNQVVPNNSHAQDKAHPSIEKKNITKVAINGANATLEPSPTCISSFRSASDVWKPGNIFIPPPEPSFGRNSMTKSALSSKKLPINSVQLDPRSMLLDQIKNFGGRENLRDSRHRE